MKCASRKKNPSQNLYKVSEPCIHQVTQRFISSNMHVSLGWRPGSSMLFGREVRCNFGVL